MRLRVTQTAAVTFAVSGCLRLGYDLSSHDSTLDSGTPPYVGGASGGTSITTGGAGSAGISSSGGLGGMAGAQATGGVSNSPGGAGAGGSSEAGAGGTGNVAGSAGSTANPTPNLCDKAKHYPYWIHSNSMAHNGPPLYAVDGNPSTRYQSAAQQDEPGDFYLQIDLHGQVSLDGLIFDYPDYQFDYPRGYEIYISDSPEPVSADLMVAGISAPPTLLYPYIRIDFPTITGRYLRIVQTGSAPNWWTVPEVSLINCSVVSVAYEPETGTDIRDRSAWRITTSAEDDPLKMVDGSVDTYWQSQYAPQDGFWVQVDLSIVGTLNGLLVSHKPGDAPVNLEISTSTDGFEFVSIGLPIAGSDIMSIPFNAQARYVRLRHVGVRDTTWWSIAELDLLP